MAKARARTTTRKPKDKWKAKQWYTVLASAGFNKAPIGESPAEEPDKLIGRIATTTMQDLTGDFKLMHVKLDFQVERVAGTQADARFVGHSLTSDYVRRLVRRNHTKIGCVVDATTKDGALVRIKPFAVSDRRCQSSQQRVLRKLMEDTIRTAASAQGLESFVKEMIDGRLNAKLMAATKPIYPLRRIEVYKSEVRNAPTITLEDIAPPEATPTDGTNGSEAPAEAVPSPEEGGPEPEAQAGAPAAGNA